MGARATGIITFGIDFGEEGDRFWKQDAEIPWTKEPWDREGISEWWLYDVLGFDLEFNDFYDEEEREVIEPEYTEVYRTKKKSLRRNNPLPVEWIMYGADAAPSYILAVKDSETSADWGEPRSIDENELFTIDQTDVENFNLFCKNHLPNLDLPEPEWLMAARYW